jgi:predicted nucleic acid-binding protein
VSLVLDTSITLSWYFEDEKTPATQALLTRVAQEGAVAPALWRLEVANGFASAIRRKRIDISYRDASLIDLAAMAIAIDPDTDSHVWSTTLRLADQHNLTIYDATYLELAQRRGLPLATLDQALRAAGTACGLTLLGVA